MTSAPNDLWISFYREGTLDGTLTFSDAEKRIDEKVEEFKALGLNSEDRVVIKMPNSIELVITHLALVRAHIIGVPVHPKETEARLAFIMEDSGAVGIFTENGFERTQEGGGEMKGKADILIYTSGTTGKPKGVCLEWKNWVANAKMLETHHHLGPETVLAAPLPIFHCNAYGLSMVSTYLSKSRLILFDGITDSFLDIVAKEKATILSIVPAILHRLMREHPEWKPNAELRYILTAAAPLSPLLLEEVLARWGIRVVQGYGMTESTNFSCTMPTDITDEEYRDAMLPNPSIGIALSNVEIRIGEKDEEGVIGELQINAETNSYGYWGMGENTTGWVLSGDLALYRTINGRRYYYHKGRVKEMINRGGEKISPVELENEMKAAGIAGEFAIISIPNEEFGEEVALASVGPFDETLLKSIPSYRRPKQIFQIPELFYTATGKVQRGKIRDWCLAN